MGNIMETSNGFTYREDFDASTGKYVFVLVQDKEKYFPHISFCISAPPQRKLSEKLVREVGRNILYNFTSNLDKTYAFIPSVGNMRDSVESALFSTSGAIPGILPPDGEDFYKGTALEVYIANKRKPFHEMSENSVISFKTSWVGGTWSKREFTVAVFPDDAIGVSRIVKLMKGALFTNHVDITRDAIMSKRFVVDAGGQLSVLALLLNDATPCEKVAPVYWAKNLSDVEILTAGRYHRYATPDLKENEEVGEVRNSSGGMPVFVRGVGIDDSKGAQEYSFLSFFAGSLWAGDLPHPSNVVYKFGESQNGYIDVWFSSRDEDGPPRNTKPRILTNIRYLLRDNGVAHARLWRFKTMADLYKAEEKLVDSHFNLPSLSASTFHNCDVSSITWEVMDDPDTLELLYEAFNMTGDDAFLICENYERGVASFVKKISGGLPIRIGVSDPDWVMSQDELDATCAFFRSYFKKGNLPTPEKMSQIDPFNHLGNESVISIWLSSHHASYRPPFTKPSTITNIRYYMGDNPRADAAVCLFDSTEDTLEAEKDLLRRNFDIDLFEEISPLGQYKESLLRWDRDEGPTTITGLQRALELENDKWRVRLSYPDGEMYAGDRCTNDMEETEEPRTLSAAELATYTVIETNLKALIPAITDGDIRMSTFDTVYQTMLNDVVNNESKPRGYGVEVSTKLPVKDTTLTLKVYKGFDPDTDDVSVYGVRLSATISGGKDPYRPSLTIDDNLSLWLNEVDRRFAFTRWVSEVREVASIYVNDVI